MSMTEEQDINFHLKGSISEGLGREGNDVVAVDDPNSDSFYLNNLALG